MIKLTGKEKQIFSLLMDLVKERKLDVTLRVAGGWVRDKLLGNESSDIDFALDKMMGQQFVIILSDYLKQHDIESHGFHVIKKDPEKSKHLEAATIFLFDLGLDFVNLRGETYTDDSRIPEQTIGTPKEDAYRRDLTINSLFYNLNEDKIEDFTGKGLSDLKAGIIRTPLDPYQTFMDDPLRILRAFRFSARFNYNVVEEIYKASKDDKIKKSFAKKISKERIGKEFDANFKNFLGTKNPFLFFRHIYDCGYWEVILQKDTNEKISMGYEVFQKLVNNYDRLNNCFAETASLLKEIEPYEVIYLSYIAVLTIEFNDPKITHLGDKILRFMLVQASWAAIRKDTQLEQFYNRVRSKNNPRYASKIAITAVARSPITRCEAAPGK